MIDPKLFTDYAGALMATALCALGISLLLVLTKRHHGHLTMDSVIGVQKFHTHPTPRVGGLAIYLGLVTGWVLIGNQTVRQIVGVILLAGLPALLCGLLEDVTKRVGVLPRLLATMASGILAWLLCGVALTRVDVPGLDQFIAMPAVGVLFTAFAVAGVANAINIIDGFHGLASGTAVIALLALAAIACRTHDAPLAVASLLAAAAVVGFWLVNYPWGKLFLGDGGAYFSGFAVGWIAILLPMRNPEVSVWSGLVVCAYPVIEVLYSVVRRYRRRQSPGAPDSRHLHSLIKTEVIRKKMPRTNREMQNASVSPFVWFFASVPAVAAIVFYSQSGLLATVLLASVVLYHLAYQKLAKSRPHASDMVGLKTS